MGALGDEDGYGDGDDGSLALVLGSRLNSMNAVGYGLYAGGEFVFISVCRTQRSGKNERR